MDLFENLQMINESDELKTVQCPNCKERIILANCDKDIYWTHDERQCKYHVCPECGGPIEEIDLDRGNSLIDEASIIKDEKDMERIVEGVKTFNISFKANDVYQANLIKGYSEEQVIEYFKSYKPDAEVIGVNLATKDDERPGKPVIDATKESKIIKDEKDIEQIVESTEIITEDSDNILDLVEAKSKRFGHMVDALGEEMPTSEVNDFLKGLTTELDMDVYEGDKPYPTDLDGYFGQPSNELDINNSDDLEMINWIDGILTECIDKIEAFIKSRIETLKGEISAIETDIVNLEAVL